MTETKSVRIPLCTVGAAIMWAAAVGLLCWATWGPWVDVQRVVLAWALLLGGIAAAWTVLAGVSLMACGVVNAIVRKITLHDQATKLTQI